MVLQTVQEEAMKLRLRVVVYDVAASSGVAPTLLDVSRALQDCVSACVAIVSATHRPEQEDIVVCGGPGVSDAVVEGIDVILHDEGI